MSSSDIRNTLHYGDCLEVMRGFPDHSIDLIYLDPPFNSKKNYNCFFQNPEKKGRGKGSHLAQMMAFTDTWTWDGASAERVNRITNAVKHPAHRAISALEIVFDRTGALAYLSYMADRLADMKRILRPSGSIYLHCDDTMSHCLRLVMDTVFGVENFRNEITWKRTTSRSGGKKYGRMADTILYYAGEGAFWQNQYHREGRVVGGEQTVALTGAGTTKGDSGQPWRGYDPASAGRGRHWSVPRDGTFAQWVEENEIPGYTKIESIHARLDALYEAGLIKFSRNGVPRYIQRVEAANSGPMVNNIWTDIALEGGNDMIRDYPTRKPVALVERMITASMPEGGVVLDPFCGCGTTIEAAVNRGCDWIGIDVSPFAINLVARERMKGLDVHVKGLPFSFSGAQKLARDHPFDFERWAVCLIPGLVPNDRQTGDKGVDGVGILLHPPEETESKDVVVQVKGGKRHQASHLRDFLHTVEREEAAMGIYITLYPIQSSDAHAEAAALGRITTGANTFPRVLLWSVGEYFETGKKPLCMPLMSNPFTGKEVNPSLF